MHPEWFRLSGSQVAVYLCVPWNLIIANSRFPGGVHAWCVLNLVTCNPVSIHTELIFFVLFIDVICYLLTLYIIPQMFLFCVSDKHFGATLERIIDFRTKLLPKIELGVSVKSFYPGK